MRPYYFEYDEIEKKKKKRYYPPRQKSSSPPALNLDIPFCIQGRRSANCGPCAVKMMLDYYHILDPKRNQLFSLQSINRYLKVTTAEGCYTDTILDFFKRFNVPLRKIEFNLIIPTLLSGHPILAFFLDEVFDAHYSVISGVKDLATKEKVLIFQDPWPDFGENYERFLNDFYTQSKGIDFWLYVLERQTPASPPPRSSPS